MPLGNAEESISSDKVEEAIFGLGSPIVANDV